MIITEQEKVGGSKWCHLFEKQSFSFKFFLFWTSLRTSIDFFFRPPLPMSRFIPGYVLRDQSSKGSENKRLNMDQQSARHLSYPLNSLTPGVAVLYVFYLLLCFVLFLIFGFCCWLLFNSYLAVCCAYSQLYTQITCDSAGDQMCDGCKNLIKDLKQESKLS